MTRTLDPATAAEAIRHAIHEPKKPTIGDDVLKAYDMVKSGSSRAEIVRATSLTLVQIEELFKRAGRGR